ncbi:hypothetical protein ACHAW5_000725 [Stephanodiscus triporus]|uniref:Uncharacterized protein n=1 Tax=Stephanodiscus triporus TaxID=2934178 RepID=A0ABD3N3G3_9STRA
MAKQLNNCTAKGRIIEGAAFGQQGDRWYVRGCMIDGTGGHSWWGGCESYCMEQIKEGVAEFSDLKVAFGSSVFGAPSFVLIKGGNGYSCHHDIDSDLISRMNRINNKTTGIINCVRLFSSGAYFMSDSEGSEWKGLSTYLDKEVESGGRDKVLDVVVARDGSWIVIRPSRFIASEGVSDKLTNALKSFYSRHQQRQQSQAELIRAYDEREQKRIAEEERAKVEAALRAKEEEDRIRAEEERKRSEEEERKRAMESALKRRCRDECVEIVAHKRLRYGMRVTAIGRSIDLGDSFVVSANSNSVAIQSADGSRFLASDPKQLATIVPIHDAQLHQEDKELMLVYEASDKYEAAISFYHCICRDGRCECTRTAFVRGIITPARPILEWTTGPQPFDEYRCAEKVDRKRLCVLIQDLKRDETQREICLNAIINKLRTESTKKLLEQEKLLRRCKLIQETAETLLETIEDLPEDSNGCVIYEVQYEHRDPSFRGRLYAKGEKVYSLNEKYPRYANLQGMPKELRLPLVGNFAFDIDAENSEYRLICSLATQLGLEALAPTLFDYRDRREHYLTMIMQLHNASRDEAKRLPNIILSAGQYTTWLRVVDKTSVDQVKRFAVKVAMEIQALRYELIRHPRFSWLSIDKEHLLTLGRHESNVEALLLPRIIQNCENEVLGILHRTFHKNGWAVRAKIFDGLIAEPNGRGSASSLESTIMDAQKACKQSGWDAVFVVKPLNGKQDEQMPKVVAAREVLARHALPRRSVVF